MAHVYTRVVRILRLPQTVRTTAIFIVCMSAGYAPASYAWSAGTGAELNGVPAPLLDGEFVPTLSLDAAIQLATRRNSDIRAATGEISAAEAALVQSGARLNPELAYSLEDLKKATRTTTVQLNQIVELGGKRNARIAAGERVRDAAAADRAVKVADIRASVIAEFFDVLVAQERLVLADASVTLAQRASEIAGKRVTAGKISPVEETKARVAQANAMLERSQANTDVVAARGRLCAMWNGDVQCFGVADGVIGDMPDVPQFGDITMLIATSPSVRRAALEVDRRHALAEVEKTRQTMDVTVSVGVKRAEDIGRNQALIGLSVPLPLFDRNHGNVLEALRRTDKARDELSATESRVRADLLQFHQQWTAARDAVLLLRNDILPGAQSAYDAAVKGFEFGKFTFLDVLDAQRTLLQAKTQYLNAVASLHRAHAEIDRLTGAPIATNSLNGKTSP